MKSVCNLGEGVYEDGIERGVGVINQLNLFLISEGRYEELERAAREESYRNLLLSEFGLSFCN